MFQNVVRLTVVAAVVVVRVLMMKESHSMLEKVGILIIETFRKKDNCQRKRIVITSKQIFFSQMVFVFEKMR